MAVYLADNPPTITQFRRSRRASPSGVVVLHTAESSADLTPPDRQALGVARYTVARRTYGSYHAIVDSENTIQLCEWFWEAWHVGTHNMNHHSVGLSVACEAHKWHTYPAWWVSAAIDNLAIEAARYADWLETNHGITIPATRIDADAAINRTPGFTTHGELDPTRRSDPGPNFPWDEFFERYEHHSGNTGKGNSGGGDSVPLNDRQEETVRQIQLALIEAGYDLGSFGADGDPGPLTEAAVKACIQDRNDHKAEFQTVSSQLREMRAEHEDVKTQLAATALDLEECRETSTDVSEATRIGEGFMTLVAQANAAAAADNPA